MSDLTKQEVKEAFKEAVKEWMNERFLEFGKWTFRAFALAVFGALTYLIMWVEGFKK